MLRGLVGLCGLAALGAGCGDDGAGADASAAGDGGGRGDAATLGDAADVDAPPVPTGTPIVVAVGYGQRRAHSYDGVAWELQQVTPEGADDNDLFRGMTWGNDLFVAVGGSSVGLTATSPDGVTWTPGDDDQRAWLGDVAWLGDTLVAAGGNGLRVRSVDGAATWIDDAGYQATHYRAVAGGAGVVVAVGHSYNRPGGDVGIIAITADGVTWDETRAAGPNFGTIAFGAGRFVAAGEAGLVTTSTDGVDWDDQTVGTGGGRVIFAGAQFVLSRGSGLYTSPDGVAWTPVDGPAQPVIGAFDGAYFAADWPLSVSRSTNLVDWTPVWTPSGSGLTEMVSGYAP